MYSHTFGFDFTTVSISMEVNKAHTHLARKFTASSIKGCE